MDVNDIYLDEGIFNIFFNLLNFYDKINFTKTNKSLFVYIKIVSGVVYFSILIMITYLFMNV